MSPALRKHVPEQRVHAREWAGAATVRRVELDGVMRLSVDALIALCEQGVTGACEELDRRGVEPPIVEPDAPPVPLAA